MAAQMDPAEKRRRADVVLDNDGSLDELGVRALAVLAGSPRPRAAEAPAPGPAPAHARLVGLPVGPLRAPGARRVPRARTHRHDRPQPAGTWRCAWPRSFRTSRHPGRGGEDGGGRRRHRPLPHGGDPEGDAGRGDHRAGAGAGRHSLPPPPVRQRQGWRRPLRRGVGAAGGRGGGLQRAPPSGQAERARRRPGGTHGKLRSAGSDAHTVFELGGASVEVPWHANARTAAPGPGARQAIVGRTASNRVHLASTWAKVRRKLPGAPALRPR